MKFALRKITHNDAGFFLCDAETGKPIPGQTSVIVNCNLGSPYLTEIRLRFYDLPLFKD